MKKDLGLHTRAVGKLHQAPIQRLGLSGTLAGTHRIALHAKHTLGRCYPVAVAMRLATRQKHGIVKMLLVLLAGLRRWRLLGATAHDEEDNNCDQHHGAGYRRAIHSPAPACPTGCIAAGPRTDGGGGRGGLYGG